MSRHIESTFMDKHAWSSFQLHISYLAVIPTIFFKPMIISPLPPPFCVKKMINKEFQAVLTLELLR